MNTAATPRVTSNATAWAYLVVSDPQQADTLADQHAWAHDLAKKRGWAITRTISGVSSGKLGPRKLTLGMIADLEAMPPEQRPERVLMIRLERLGRGDGLEAMNAFLQIRKLNITVHTRLDGDVGCDKASELLMPVLRFFIGGMENEVRRDKLLALYDRRRESRKTDPTVALSSRSPYGLVYRDGHLVPQSPEDGAVRLAYELKSQGYGSHLIGKRLALVAPPLVRKDGSRHPQKWNADRVSKLIRKESYCGTIVDEELWHRAQQPIREVTRRTQRLEYPLGGALLCECGSTLVGQKGTGRPSCTFHYYQCRNMAAHAGRMKHYRSDYLESQFVGLLRRLRADDTLVSSYLASKNSKESAETLAGQLAAMRGDESRFEARRRTLFEAYEEGALPRSDLQWRLGDLATSQSELQQRIERIDRELAMVRASRAHLADVKALVAAASENWPKAAIDDRRALAKAVSRAFGGLRVSAGGELTLALVGPDGARSTPHSASKSPSIASQVNSGGTGRHALSRKKA